MDVPVEVDPAHGLRLEPVGERLQRDRDRELADAEDPIRMTRGTEPLADLPAALLIESEESLDVVTDERGPGTRAPLGLVVADHRRDRVERLGEVPLGDPEVLPPLAQSPPRVGREDDLAGDLFAQGHVHANATMEWV